MTATPTPQRLQLSRELRAWRQRRSIEPRQVAARLVCSLSKVSKIENGQANISPLELQILLEMYEVPEGETTERIKAIAEAARQRSQYRVEPWVRAYINMETEAVEISYFQVELIPGLLQTEAYTRVIAAAHGPDRRPVEVERLVKIRQQRQARLTDDNPPALSAVIHESALRTWVGGADVMHDQLAKLLQLAALPNVTIQVLPFRAGEHRAMGTAFTILRLDTPADSQVVYLEDLWDANYVTRPEQVATYTEAFDRLVEVSLDETGTVAMIETAMGELR